MKHFDLPEQLHLFNEFLSQFKVSFSKPVIDQLVSFAEMVVEGNEVTNLISKNDAPKIFSRHITDSLIPCLILNQQHKNLENLRWADMGSGSGFPVIPLAIACPQTSFFAVEPRTKRVQFLESVKQKLSLQNLNVIGKRFETSELKDLDVISCRALSSFENDWERAKKSLKKDGIFVTLKSLDSVSHLQNSKDLSIIRYTLPKEEKNYALLIRGFYE
ncbi:MAG: 16S rRNA (guanine(527)-N(7))-methyltransferase RsmG [Fibrobacter sp.]|nr:16S rRNA (guanine(527)-N(7))-methyltransferase RsmG [Fibrobacter sp.]